MNRLGAKLGVFVGYWDWDMGKLIFPTATTPAAERNVKYAIDVMASDPSHAIASHTFSRALPNVLFYETAPLMKASILDPLRTLLRSVEDRYVFGRIAPAFFVADLARVGLFQRKIVGRLLTLLLDITFSLMSRMQT